MLWNVEWMFKSGTGKHKERLLEQMEKLDEYEANTNVIMDGGIKLGAVECQ